MADEKIVGGKVGMEVVEDICYTIIVNGAIKAIPEHIIDGDR